MNTENQNSKIVLVTGASRGIGKSIALNAAKRRIGVIITYNSNPDQGKAVADTINSSGGKAVALSFVAKSWRLRFWSGYLFCHKKLRRFYRYFTILSFVA